MADWEYDMLGCTSCGSALCDEDCPEAYEDSEQEQAAIVAHVKICELDICYTCQCL